MLAVAVLVASCGGGVDLSSEDQSLAAEFWSNLNEFEQEELCEGMDAASARADVARAIEEVIEDRELSGGTDALGELDDDAIDEERVEALIAPATEEANRARADRAVDIVKYLQSNC